MTMTMVLIMAKKDVKKAKEAKNAKPQWIGGYHPIYSALQHHPENILQLCLDKQRQDQRMTSLVTLAEKWGIPMTWCRANTFRQHLGPSLHQGMMMFYRLPQIFDQSKLEQIISFPKKPKQPLILALDTIQDPHNLGACLRTSDAVGVDAVVIPKHQSVGLTATVYKVASGAVETLPLIQVNNLSQSLEWLKQQGLWIVGLSHKGQQSLYQTDLNQALVMVVGNEEKGLRQGTEKHCDYLVSLPMQGWVDSLNVSVATGVSLYEVWRQRSIEPI